MARNIDNYDASMREALETFDLKKFIRWVKKYNPLVWQDIKNDDKNMQMAIMCKTICNRTDMLSTEAHKKAVQWLKEHNMGRKLF